MKFRYQLRRAVSPVIAVVLMIALVVAASAVVWSITQNLTTVGGELIITKGPTYSDSPDDPDLLIDKITMTVQNIGSDPITLQSATLEQSTGNYVWNVISPTTEITQLSTSQVVLEAPSISKQLAEGKVIITIAFGDDASGIFQAVLNIPASDSVDVYYYAYYAYGYQNEGTLASGNYSSLISDLDSTTAPSVPDGSVTVNYFATGGSDRFYDALALRFNIGPYSPALYTATLRMFIFDGGYSTTWHHYLIQTGETNTSYQNSSPPGVATAWDDNADNGPSALQIDITLASWAWTSGDFWLTLRLWDAKVDLIQLIMTPTN